MEQRPAMVSLETGMPPLFGKESGMIGVASSRAPPHPKCFEDT